MKFNENIVKKPWGYEYLVYENDDVGLWFLYISKDQSTSTHCHPKKTTGLVVLDGEAELSFNLTKSFLSFGVSISKRKVPFSDIDFVE